MGFDLGFVAAYSKKDLGHPMAYVILYHIAEQEQGNQHTHTRKHQKQPFIVQIGPDVAIQKVADVMDGFVKNDCGAPREHADYQTQKQKEIVLRQLRK